MNNYFTIKNFLSTEETKKLLNFSKKNFDLKPGTIDNNELNEKRRKSSITFINYDNIYPFLKERLIVQISEKIKLKGYEINFENQPFQFTQYKKGEHYNWHTDSDLGINSKRYCSIVIQLNDKYTGGDLEMSLEDSDEIIKFENGIGNLFVFLSSILHRVTPITTGTRYSLVSWFSVKPIENYKKTLI